jgi:hypothetical protein
MEQPVLPLLVQAEAEVKQVQVEVQLVTLDTTLVEEVKLVVEETGHMELRLDMHFMAVMLETVVLAVVVVEVGMAEQVEHFTQIIIMVVEVGLVTY